MNGILGSMMHPFGQDLSECIRGSQRALEPWRKREDLRGPQRAKWVEVYMKITMCSTGHHHLGAAPLYQMTKKVYAYSRARVSLTINGYRPYFGICRSSMIPCRMRMESVSQRWVLLSVMDASSWAEYKDAICIL